ncbi:hypothetical protein AB205_0145720 [Aquarana catesbeiana]|uniref:Chemokine interleukin-8-like domain-containing protein n=1 Tax=Aquarana catesbeiana TaxID=8400 RepID=A0A2G9RSY6_AQUCT|nr:hypothetical protein AB205_0145720 [Aquarana catesbeiana]
MATRRNLYVLSFAFLVMVLDVSQAFGSHDCCIKYSKKKPSLKIIDGYYQQKSTEICDIDAIMNQRTQKGKRRRLKTLKKSCNRLKKQLY